MGLSLAIQGLDKVISKLQSMTKMSDEARDRLMRIGEEVCNHARTITPGHSSGGYDDQTHNLRSSIGYNLYYNGELIGVGGLKSTGGQDGESAAKNALNTIENQEFISPIGWTLIVVAGMSYATYVEAKGYNVLNLSGSELKKLVEKLAKDLYG